MNSMQRRVNRLWAGRSLDVRGLTDDELAKLIWQCASNPAELSAVAAAMSDEQVIKVADALEALAAIEQEQAR